MLSKGGRSFQGCEEPSVQAARAGPGPRHIRYASRSRASFQVREHACRAGTAQQHLRESAARRRAEDIHKAHTAVCAWAFHDRGYRKRALLRKGALHAATGTQLKRRRLCAARRSREKCELPRCPALRVGHKEWEEHPGLCMQPRLELKLTRTERSVSGKHSRRQFREYFLHPTCWGTVCRYRPEAHPSP